MAIPSISTDGEHGAEIDRTASLTCQQMREAGLQNVDVLRVGNSLPYAYGEWLEAPGKPTVFLYAHHDVQPINFERAMAQRSLALDPPRRPALMRRGPPTIRARSPRNSGPSPPT